MLNYSNEIWRDLYCRFPVHIQNLATSIYGFRHKKKKYGRYYWKHLAFLEQSQWYSYEALKNLQDQRVKDFVSYAASNVPYYRELFSREKISPGAIQCVEDLRGLPLLDKETICHNNNNLESPLFNNKDSDIVRIHTSGTTGKALQMNVSLEAWQREYAFREIHYSWGKIRSGMRIASFAGHPVVPTYCLSPPFWRHNWAENQLLFSSQHITLSALPYYVEKLRQFRPELVHGYPSSVYLVALWILDTGLSDIRPIAVFTHSETLLDFQRHAIECAFGCKVFNWYGNSEQVANIVECEYGGLHVKMEHSAVEFIKPDGRPARAGEQGNLVCTSFGNYATPLIRYRLNDIAIPSDRVCDCGRQGQLVEEISGRVEDIIVTPDGRHVGRLDHLFKDMLNVREAQIIQERVDDLTIKIVKRPNFSESDMKLLEKEARLRLGSAIKLRYEFVDTLSRDPSGKLRFVVSKVPINIRHGRQLLSGNDATVDSK